MANAATDAFHKEDVQQLALALNGHDHTTGKGLGVNVSSIADNSLSGAKLTDGTVTSAKILDGTIQSADIAAAGIANDRLGPDVARANLLTNGGFEIWQRGNGPFTANGAFTTDRWQINLGGTSTISVSRDTVNVDASSLAAAAVTYTHNVGSALNQKLEDYAQLRGQTLTLSARVRTNTSSAVRVRIDSSVAAGTPSAYHTGDGTWRTLTVTQLVPAAATSITVLVTLETSCTVYVDNVCLVIGSQAANYVPLHPADDLARCLRYYYRRLFDDDGAPQIQIIGYNTATNVISQNLFHHVPLPVTPTVTMLGTWTTNNCGAPSASLVTRRGFVLSATVTATAQAFFYNAGAGQGVSVEANPLIIPVGFLMMQGAQPDYVVYGLALIAVWMMGMNAERTADLARRLRQLPCLDRLIDRLRGPAATVRAVALRMFRPVLT